MDRSSDRQNASETTALLGAAQVAQPAEAVEALADGAAKKGYGATGDRNGTRNGDGPASSSSSSSVAPGSVVDEETAPAAGPDDGDDRIPKAQVFWLCMARLVEPVAFFSIFPYISEMVKHNGGLADADVGFYNGLTESLFSLTQAAVMISWGRLADRAGRKPALVASLAGVAVATAAFGLSTSLLQMAAARCLAGVFAGSVVTVRAMLADVSTPATQARVFSWFAFSGNLGIFVGSLMGGALVDPAHQYGGVFARSAFLRDYPYALPSFAVGALSAVACVTTALFVKETLPSSDDDDDGDDGKVLANSSSSNDDDDGDFESEVARKKASAAEKARQESIWQLLHEPGVQPVLLNFAWLYFVASGYTVIIPLWWFTPVSLGGFGFTPLQISVMTAFTGIVQAVWLLVVFPPLQRRRGTNGVMRLCAAAYPLFFAVAPVANALLRLGLGPAFWAFFPPSLALSSGVAMAFTASQLAINEVSPSPRVLGTLTAFSLMMTSVSRAVCPALFTSLFAIGARTQLLGGYAIWALLAALAAGFAAVTRLLPDYEELRRQRLERVRAEAGDATVASGLLELRGG
ncbi:hypothetical protein RB597_007901 [Gaeumannomyces tritici]